MAENLLGMLSLEPDDLVEYQEEQYRFVEYCQSETMLAGLRPVGVKCGLLHAVIYIEVFKLVEREAFRV